MEAIEGLRVHCPLGGWDASLARDKRQQTGPATRAVRSSALGIARDSLVFRIHALSAQSPSGPATGTGAIEFGTAGIAARAQAMRACSQLQPELLADTASPNTTGDTSALQNCVNDSDMDTLEPSTAQANGERKKGEPRPVLHSLGGKVHRSPQKVRGDSIRRPDTSGPDKRQASLVVRLKASASVSEPGPLGATSCVSAPTC